MFKHLVKFLYFQNIQRFSITWLSTWCSTLENFLRTVEDVVFALREICRLINMHYIVKIPACRRISIIVCAVWRYFIFMFKIYLTTPSTFYAQTQKYLEASKYFKCRPIVSNYKGTSVNSFLGSKLDTGTKYFFSSQRVKSVLINCRSHQMASFNAFPENKWEE